jgi:hypothetical protein
MPYRAIRKFPIICAFRDEMPEILNEHGRLRQ